MQNPDGTITATIGSGPIQAPDPSSPTGWSPVNTDLRPTADGLVPEATVVDITISDGTEHSAPLATVAQDGQTLSVAPSGEGPGSHRGGGHRHL